MTMTFLETLGEAELLRAEGERLLASTIGGLARRLGRSIAERWNSVVDLTIRETRFHLESDSHRATRKSGRGGEG